METIKIPAYVPGYKVDDYLNNLNLDNTKTYRIIILNKEKPDEIASCFSLFLIRYNKNNISFSFDEYNDCYYIGTEDNPYYSLYKVKEGVKKLTIHPDCKHICSEAASNHKTLEEIYIDNEKVLVGSCSFQYCSNLKKITFTNSKDVMFGYKAFNGCYQLKDINIDIDGGYFFGERSFESGRYILPLPRKFERNSYALSENAALLFVPKEITSLISTAVNPDAEFYYEGDLSTLEIKPVTYDRYETEDDYGWNFHRSSGSFTYHETKNPAIFAHNGKSNATYEDFLKRKEELLNK